MKKLFITLLGILFFMTCYSQEKEKTTEKILRLNFINPGIEIEWPVFNKSTIATNLGIGYGGSFPNLTYTSGSGWLYMIAPFIDIEYRKIYNQEKRFEKGKNIEYNSGNFWGLRFLTRGKEIKSNVNRTDDIDFSVGPIWGIQRNYGKINLLFDFGPVYYFDTKGNSGIFPIVAQLNIGFNLKKFEDKK